MAAPARRVLSSANFLATVGLLAVLFIFINFIASRRYARADLSRQRTTTLSEQTAQALRGLAEPVSVTVFLQPASRLYELTHDLLDEYARRSPRVRVEYVDPQQDIARARQLVKELEIDDLNVIVFRAGGRRKHLAPGERVQGRGRLHVGDHRGHPRDRADRLVHERPRGEDGRRSRAAGALGSQGRAHAAGRGRGDRDAP
jgi:hypothetical protein